MNSLRLIAEVAQALVGHKDFDSRLVNVLSRIGAWAKVSRVYVFLDDRSGKFTSNTHEWCASGIASQKNELQQIPYQVIPSWQSILLQDGRILSEDVARLPEDLRVGLERQGIKSLVVYPLVIEGRIGGFVGFDDCVANRHWTGLELTLLQTLSGLISNAYEAKLDRDRLRASEDNFRTFFNTIDDLILIGDSQGKVLYINDAVTQKLGYSREELAGTSLLDLHPADTREEASRILEAMFRRERDTCPLELERKDGTRLPVETRIWFGRWDGTECLFGICKDLGKEQEALQKFTRLFENNPALMAISSMEDGGFLEVNRAFVERLGYTKQEVLGRTSTDLGLLAQAEQRARVTVELQRSGSVHGVELEVRHKDGGVLYGLVSAEVIRSQGRQLLLTVVVDISEQVSLRSRLASERQRLENVIQGTALGTWEWNVQTGQTIFNARWAEMIGYTLQELEPISIETWTKFCHPEDLSKSGALLEKHFSGESDYYEFEGRMRHKDGHWVWILDRGKVIEWDNAGRPLWMFGTHLDITEKKLLAERIRELSIRDALTNVLNRRHLFERIEEMVAETKRTQRRFSLCVLDLDHFKNVNDQYGHLGGDMVLRELASIIMHMIRPYDLVGRFGGEEFIVVMPNTSAAQAASAMERILAAAHAREIVYKDNRLRVTFSCGVVDSSELSPDPHLLDAMLEEADSRLYMAKRTGRDRVFGMEATSVMAPTSGCAREMAGEHLLALSHPATR